jgi:hypothetical protein
VGLRLLQRKASCAVHSQKVWGAWWGVHRNDQGLPLLCTPLLASRVWPGLEAVAPKAPVVEAGGRRYSEAALWKTEREQSSSVSGAHVLQRAGHIWGQPDLPLSDRVISGKPLNPVASSVTMTSPWGSLPQRDHKTPTVALYYCFLSATWDQSCLLHLVLFTFLPCSTCKIFLPCG